MGSDWRHSATRNTPSKTAEPMSRPEDHRCCPTRSALPRTSAKTSMNERGRERDEADPVDPPIVGLSRFLDPGQG